MNPLITFKQTTDPDALIEGSFHSTLFDKDVVVYVEPEASLDYAEACAAHFNDLSESQIDEFCDMAIEYCEFMREEWGNFSSMFEDISEDIASLFQSAPQGREVLKGTDIRCLFVSAPRSEEPAYSVELDCVWEPEHGLDWIIRGNKNLYAGPCEALGPWCEPEEYDWIY